MADIKNLSAQKQALLQVLLPKNREIVGTMMAEMDEALLPDAERREVLRSAFGDHEMSLALAEARVRRIFNNIEATTVGSSFFEMEVLGEAEWPIYVVETDDKVYVNYIGENGKPPKRQLVISESPYQVPLQWLASEEVEYSRRSIYHGDLRSFERVNRRIELDLRYQRDVNCLALLDAGQSATFPAGVLSAHRLVNSNNLPTGNYLDLSAQGSLNLVVFKSLLAYADKAGLTVTSIHVPSGQTAQMRDFVSLVAAVASTGGVENPALTIPDEMRTELFRSGRLNDFFGNNIDIVGHNVLTPNYGYAATNEPAGYMPVKPDLDEVILDDSKDMLKKNKESLMARKVEAYYMPAPNRKNFIKFRFL